MARLGYAVVGRVALGVALMVATGCSGADPADAGRATPAAVPTALGDPSRVEVLQEGAEPRRTLRLSLDQGTTTAAMLRIDQEVSADDEITDPPGITVPFAVEVTDSPGGADGFTATQTFDRAEVAPGTSPADAGRVRRSLESVDGATDTLRLGADGSLAASTSEDPILVQLRTQVRALVPVFPADEVGVGSSWSVTSVVDVDGATLDQVATYTLDGLDEEAYVVTVSVEQQYRPGVVEDVSVVSGRGTVTGRFEGTLDGVLPTAASADVSTQVTYDLGETVTEVRTTIGLDLVAG